VAVGVFVTVDVRITVDVQLIGVTNEVTMLVLVAAPTELSSNVLV
jgi:hypothetical protein